MLINHNPDAAHWVNYKFDFYISYGGGTWGETVIELTARRSPFFPTGWVSLQIGAATTVIINSGAFGTNLTGQQSFLADDADYFVDAVTNAWLDGDEGTSTAALGRTFHVNP